MGIVIWRRILGNAAVLVEALPKAIHKLRDCACSKL